MAFEQSQRNRLARFVASARTLLVEEFTAQLQSVYLIDPVSGSVAGMDAFATAADEHRETARILRETLEHYLAATPKATQKDKIAALDRILREQAFTVLNRLCALRLAEAREILIECVAKGYQSQGFQLYSRLAGSGLGETGGAYRTFLFSMFDECAVDLPGLFDRYSPTGRLFPRPPALLDLLAEINHYELDFAWAEDETIGWIYQYFNSQEERRQMRAESQAPRNSRELAVRNQFFTPRYVVEFLTDNTLGRIWYEMTKGETRLVDQCRYLVRRPVEIFLDPQYVQEENSEWVKKAAQGDFSALPDDPEIEDLSSFSLLWIAYDHTERLGYGDFLTWAQPVYQQFEQTGALPSSPLELWFLLFGLQRDYAHATGLSDETIEQWKTIFRAFKASLNREGLSQEELLREPLFVGHRPIKDPRTILMLDPACGSMHFGLYAFDLFLAIYAEAWELEERRGSAALARPDNLPSLHGSFPDRESFLREAPRLILEQNIHGIDIDPRAVQIAGLSLWLRAHRAWRAQGVPMEQRPTITRTNVVCAEPMPGDEALLDEFLAALRNSRLEHLIRRVMQIPEHQTVRATQSMAEALTDLVRHVWQEMKLAGEAGSLLKIEESLAAAVAKTRGEWDAKLPLFRMLEFGIGEDTEARLKPKVSYARLSNRGEEDFFDRAEAIVLAALEEYATLAEDAHAYQRRLFAGDAQRGFAFIDLCRKRYDVVLMNPPFGAASVPARSYLSTEYAGLWSEIYASFFARASTLLEPGGRVGALSSRAFLTRPTFRELRDRLLEEMPLKLLCECGLGVLDDATVRAAFTVFSRTGLGDALAYFWDLRSSQDRGQDLLTSIEKGSLGAFVVSLDSFSRLPGKPLAYWLPRDIARLIAMGPALDSNRFEALQAGSSASVRVGVSTSDDFRFIRCNWEVPSSRISKLLWARFARSGGFTRYYTPTYTVIWWHGDARELLSVVDGHGNVRARIRYSDNLFDSGLMSPYVSELGLGCSFLPADQVVSHSCRAYFNFGIDPGALLGYLNSALVDKMMYAFTPDRSHEASMIAALPVSSSIRSHVNELDGLARSCWEIAVQIRAEAEVDPLFCIKHGTRNENRLSALASDYATHQRDLDDLVNRACLSHGSEQSAGAAIEFPHDLGIGSADEESDIDANVSDSSTSVASSSWISEAIGISFGRWDIRYATGERTPPPLPDPFAPLPVCPPGMLQNGAGLPAAPEEVPVDYPLRISWGGILVDDAGHPEDVEERLREALQVIWGERAGAIEAEACQILGVDSLRAWMQRGFFEDHLKRYSKSRRVAPIYWPLSTSGGSYTLWLYYHRLTDQTLYRCVNDFVDPKRQQVETERAQLSAQTNRTRAEERELERLTALAAELAAFRAELLRVAEFWKPNLNDGVQITAAPLWSLFRHRQFQKRLKETWQKLKAGDYDWAHLAYSIWPERVEEKCMEDKSLAIAHDLEHLYVEPPPSAKKKGKKKVQPMLDEEDEDL